MRRWQRRCDVMRCKNLIRGDERRRVVILGNAIGGDVMP